MCCSVDPEIDRTWRTAYRQPPPDATPIPPGRQAGRQATRSVRSVRRVTTPSATTVSIPPSPRESCLRYNASEASAERRWRERDENPCESGDSARSVEAATILEMAWAGRTGSCSCRVRSLAIAARTNEDENHRWWSPGEARAKRPIASGMRGLFWPPAASAPSERGDIAGSTAPVGSPPHSPPLPSVPHMCYNPSREWRPCHEQERNGPGKT